MTLKFPASGGREALIPTCLPFSKIEYCATSTIQTLHPTHHMWLESENGDQREASAKFYLEQ